MPGNKESLYPADWIEKAKRDLRRVKVLLADNDTEGAGFHLQQGIEKYLKGYLLSRGWKLEHIHDLVKLINHAKDYEPAFEEFRALCEKVTDYYILDRYPLFGRTLPTNEEVGVGLRRAEELGSRIDAAIK